MDNKETFLAEEKAFKEELSPGMRREIDSLDDFEHLGHDSSPLKETESIKITTEDLLGNLKSEFSRDQQGTINKGVDLVASVDPRIIDEGILTSLSSSSSQPLKVSENLFPDDRIKEKPSVMDSNLFEMGDGFPDRREADEKLDKFLQEMQLPSTKHQDIPENRNKDLLDDFKNVTRDFVDMERNYQEVGANIPQKTNYDDIVDRFTSSVSSGNNEFSPKLDDFDKDKNDKPLLDTSTDDLTFQSFKDVDEIAPVLLHNQPILEPKPAEAPTIPAPERPEPVKKAPEVKTDIKAPAHPPPEPPAAKKIEEKRRDEIKVASKKSTAIDAEVFFCKMGLDTWFNPEKLNPKVESLIYWREPKKSGPVFGGVLFILLALTYFSLITVAAHASLLVLGGTIAFRIYKNVVQAVQKTGDGHPFKEFLELDLTLSPEKIKEVSEVIVAHVNAGISELRRLFLVEDLVDSLKFGVFLWSLTYLGAWFNGMTLVILSWIALFTLPKVYETNKTQIDANLEIVRTKLAEITAKVKAAIPIGKKEEKKEQ